MKDGKLNKNKYYIFLLLLMLILPSCIKETPVSDKKPATEQTIEKFVITETQDGKIKTILEAKSAIINETQQIAYLTLPEVKFYDNGKYTSTLNAQSGEINLDTNDIKALGDCKVQTVNNEYLETKDVFYDHLKNIIYSESEIKITKANDIIYGKGFESDTKLNNIVIKNQRVILD